MNGLRDTSVLRSEQKMIASPPGRFTKTAVGLGREKPESLRSTCFKVGLPAGMLDEVDVLPVIHACPLQMFVIDLKTEWVDEVQARTDRQACSSDVSGVVGNQRGAEHDVQAGVGDGTLQWTVLVRHGMPRG